MKKVINETLRGKGEGIILKQPHSPYQQGSSKLVLKFKIFIDEEALVTQIKCSIYTCLMVNGNTFQTRRIEEDVQKKIKISDVISYKHTKTSINGKPIQPKIYQIRRDLTWNDVLIRRPKLSPNIATDKRKWAHPREQTKFFDEFAKFITAWTKLHPEFMLQKENFLSSEERLRSPGNQRKSFGRITRSNQLGMNWWYSAPHTKLTKVGRPELFNYYNDMDLFKEGWKVPGNQRKFLDEFAISKKFNPLDAQNWYSITKREIIPAGGSGLLSYYKGSHIKALIKLYPELKLKRANFLMSKKGWKAPTNQRKFFDSFARSKKFSPLDAENWYSISKNQIKAAGGSRLLSYYNGSHIRALAKLYPEILLKFENFLQFKGNQKHLSN